MRSRNAQQIIARLAAVRDLEELPLDAVMDHRSVSAIIALQVVARGRGNSNQTARPARRYPQEKRPERKVEPAKIFRMTLVLQVVKNCDHRALAGDGCGESRIEQ